MAAYNEIAEQVQALHEDDKHDEIIALLDEIPRDDWDFTLTSLYARALNNLERYQDALVLLLDVESEGREDGLWNFRVGYALYYLNREAEAAEYFEKAIKYGDDCEDTRMLLEASREEAQMKEEQAKYNPETYTEDEMTAVEAHIEKYFGSNKNVFHELVSPDIHVDIVIIEPTPERNYYVLVTMGMGAHKMNVPEDLAEYHLERAELVVCLPPDWEMTEEAMRDENWYWPLRWLKIMARLPGEHDTWLGWGHTVPAGEPFAENTRFTTMMLLSPGAFDKAASECALPDGNVVNFYQMIPLYEEEVQFKLKTEVKLLLKLFDDESESLECVNLHRRNVCKKT